MNNGPFLMAFLIPALALSALLLTTPVLAVTATEQANAQLARQFYEQVWFSNHPDAVDQLFDSEYVIHDMGGLDGLLEPASMQKDIAGFLWQNGRMGGSIDFQIAQDDLVATRWHWDYQPTSWWMRLLMTGSQNPIPIINVFRFKDGRIVEVWNHRHDIDIGFRFNPLLLKGFFAGVLCCVLISLLMRVFRSHSRKQRGNPNLTV